MSEMTDEDLANLWLQYADENSDKGLKELESPISFAKFLTKSRRIASFQHQIYWLWVAVIVLSVSNIAFAAAILYVVRLVKIWK